MPIWNVDISKHLYTTAVEYSSLRKIGGLSYFPQFIYVRVFVFKLPAKKHFFCFSGVVETGKT